ncbi:MAG: formate/nitrite transporter family protein, partial [Fusobacterium periodonticum]|nr:formate/nitrite transporter family protein [Fusobacterium periodonticum]
CNVLVCGAVIQSYTSRDTIGKLVGAWLPIMLFVLIGYDHSIANMFYLTAAKLADTSLFGVSGILYNLFYVTLGNILGALAIGLPLYFSYYKKSDN